MEEWSCELRLNSPLTEEQWDALEDYEFDHTNRIWFQTKKGKTVEFVKRKRARWTKENGIFLCTLCGSGFKDQPTCMGKPMFLYCPLCGADMREE